ncbi:hypothetical protein ACHAWF_014481 [Thalassiosira exigua]
MVSSHRLLALFAATRPPHRHRPPPAHRRRRPPPLPSAVEVDDPSPEAAAVASGDEPSRWRKRTARRRERAERLLDAVEAGGLPPLGLGTPPLTDADAACGAADDDVPTLLVPPSSRIDWDSVPPDLDPVRGGKLRGGTDRGRRKRRQVEAFHHAVTSLLDSAGAATAGGRFTIVDAGCGAGNLAIPLAGLLASPPRRGDFRGVVEVLAVDVNGRALERLSDRARSAGVPDRALRTCRADLADWERVRSTIPPDRKAIVVSLHACGAASDMAMELAFRCNSAPFVICPCCTAKSLTKRGAPSADGSAVSTDGGGAAIVEGNASFHRSGATSDIRYPRSAWLRSKLEGRDGEGATSAADAAAYEKYSLLARVADVGLGPQTPSRQREHQRRAKRIVELDRLMAASEDRGYAVRLARVADHDPSVYGKGEVLLGGMGGTAFGEVLMNL